jgi:hypothetical protein
LAAVACILLLAWSPLGAWQGVAREGTPLPSSSTHLTVQLTTQQPTSQVSGVPHRVYPVDAYFPGNDIWLAIPAEIGGVDRSGAAVRVYVTHHRDSLNGWVDGAALKDCSGGFESVMLQAGSSADNSVLAWGGASALGRYDVIVDFAPFGVYNVGLDLIDHSAIGGFQILDSRAIDYAMVSPQNGCCRIIGTQSYVGGLYEPTEAFELQTWDDGPNNTVEYGGGDDIFQGTIAASWSLQNFVDHQGNPIDVDLVGRIDPNTGLYIGRNVTGEGDVRAQSGLWDETAITMTTAPTWVP